jgi:hypothetical protein
MATRKSSNTKPADEEQQKSPGTSVSTSVVSVEQMMKDAKKGMEGTSAESFAIPFISILQKGSPQVDEEDGAYMPKAKAGMFFLNVNSRLFDGKAGIDIVHCAYRRVFLHWAREGFRGELLPEQVTEMLTEGRLVQLDNRMYFPDKSGDVDPEKSDRVAEVRNHYVLLINPARDGAAVQALISLGSTQIKKSKTLMTALANELIEAPDGHLFNPPAFASVIHADTVGESNEKGTWYGWRFGITGRTRALDYAAAQAFNRTVAQGKVVATYEGADTLGADDRGGI